MPMVVVSDFDDTIVDADTGRLVLDRFADGDWQYYDRLYDEMRMPVDEVLTRQFAMVKATRDEMLAAVVGSARFREGFEELLQACDRWGVPFVIASYGLDFCIRHYLARVPLGLKVKVYAPTTRTTGHGVSFTFPKPLVAGTENI